MTRDRSPPEEGAGPAAAGAMENGAFRAAMEESIDPMAILNGTGRHVFANEAYAELHGYDDPDELLRREWDLLYPQEELERLRGKGLEALREEGRWRAEMVGVRQDGSLFMQEITLTRLPGDRILCVTRDISRDREAEERLKRMAYHDPLTGLANRRMLQEKARQLLALASRGGQDVALLYLDLDGFKEINDTHGHAAGDLVLQEVARRIADSIREADTAGRLGGDEFGVLLSDLEGEAAARRVARRIIGKLEDPCVVDGEELQVDASIGISLFPRHASDFPELLRQADRAMYGAGRGKEVGIRFYRPGIEIQAPRHRGLAEELREALRGYRLVLYYQPVCDLRSGDVVGAEALVRWPHPRLGLLPAAKFVPLAEDAGLATRLDRWVLASAVLQAKSWLETEGPEWIAVHLSEQSLEDAGLEEYLRRVLKGVGGLPPDRLVLEVPASTAMRGSQDLDRRIRSLRDAGPALAVDGFGSGRPSARWLRRFPAQLVNLDRSFIGAIRGSRDDQSFLRSVIELAHSLDLRVRAKGVERQYQQDWLARSGCDYAQGYLVGWTAPPEELTGEKGNGGGPAGPH